MSFPSSPPAPETEPTLLGDRDNRRLGGRRPWFYAVVFGGWLTLLIRFGPVLWGLVDAADGLSQALLFGYFPAAFFAGDVGKALPFMCLGMGATFLVMLLLTRGKRTPAEVPPGL